MNLRKRAINAAVDNEVVKSNETLRYTAQVNKQIQAFTPPAKYTGPAKSTPVTSNTDASLTRSNESGGSIHCKDLIFCLLHRMKSKTKERTARLERTARSLKT